MLSLLPDFADPLRLCALGKAYEGAIPLADLPRLAPLLTSTEGEAAFVLEFDRDATRRATVHVKVQATLALQCQRCLETMTLPVNGESRLVVVDGPAEAERLPEDVDPLLVEDAALVLRSLIEDELILAIPPSPMHSSDACAMKLEQINAAADELTIGDVGNKAHPFASLATWRSDDDKQD
ncbi:MAG: YceD family protein [Sedimenticolaceae bacterium]